MKIKKPVKNKWENTCLIKDGRRIKLNPKWCNKKNCKIICYPDDNQCSCGVGEEHVHCQHGNIIQMG